MVPKWSVPSKHLPFQSSNRNSRKGVKFVTI